MYIYIHIERQSSRASWACGIDLVKLRDTFLVAASMQASYFVRQHFVDHHLLSPMTESWGLCPPNPPTPGLTAPHTCSTQMLQAQLAEDGYLLFRKLLDVDKVLALRRCMHTRTHTRDTHAGSHISGNTLCAHDHYTQPHAHGKTLSWPNLMMNDKDKLTQLNDCTH